MIQIVASIAVLFVTGMAVLAWSLCRAASTADDRIAQMMGLLSDDQEGK